MVQNRFSALQSRLQTYGLRQNMHRAFAQDRRVVPVTDVLTTVRMLEDKGISREESLAGTSIELDRFDRVSYRQRIAQLERMLQLTGFDGHWLQGPWRASLSDYGLLGYAMMSCATLEQALPIAVKYHRLPGRMFELNYDVQTNNGNLRIDDLLPQGQVGQYVVEELFMKINRLVSLLLGKSHQPAGISLAFAQPAYAEQYSLAFGCEVSFGQTHSSYQLPAELLSAPLAEPDVDTAAMCESAARRLLSQMQISEEIVSKISQLLLSNPGEFPKLDSVANRLSLGARTLRRRLHELGTSYQKILDDVRRELAIEYLRTTNLSVQEIAELLGYSEVTNFRRAFMRWVELSPYQYRKQFMSPA